MLKKQPKEQMAFQNSMAITPFDTSIIFGSFIPVYIYMIQVPFGIISLVAYINM